MPFSFKVNDDISEYAQFKSVLIVPCRFCPAASSAVRNNEPYFEFLRKFLKTDSYERYIESLKSSLEERGIRTSIFRSRLIHQFVLCMWMSGRRKKLLDRAREYEALIVLGCETAVQTVRDSVESSSCKVVQGLKTEGVMSIKPRFHLPCNLSLELQSITPLLLQKGQSKQVHS
ncbi:MAG: hypothetical protein ACFFCW_43475 [Candidatus Hodarchaeota archaeon]